MRPDDLEPFTDGAREALGAFPSDDLAPSAGDKAAVLSRISASLKVAAVAGVVGGSSAAAAPLLAGKVIAVAIASVAVGVAGGVAIDRTVLAPPPAERIVYVPVKAEPPPAVMPEPPATGPATLPVKPRPKDARPAAPVVEPVQVAPPSSEERQLVEEARTALLKREPAAALASLARHQAQFPQGQLAEERDALEVQALAQAGQPAKARAAAQAFAARYPGSIFLAAVQAAAEKEMGTDNSKSPRQ